MATLQDKLESTLVAPTAYVHLRREMTPEVVIGFTLYLEKSNTYAIRLAADILRDYAVATASEENPDAVITVIPGFEYDYARDDIQVVLKVRFHQGYILPGLATKLFEAMGFNRDNDWSIGIVLKMQKEENLTRIRLTTQDTDDVEPLNEALRNVDTDMFRVAYPHGDMSHSGRQIVEFIFDKDIALADALKEMEQILHMHLFVTEPVKPISPA